MRLLLFAPLCAALLICQATAADLMIPGTGDSEHVLRALAAEFNKGHGIHVKIPPSIGTKGGIKEVVDGKALVARVAGIKSAENEKLGLVYLKFAESPVTFASHKTVDGVENITRQNVLDIYSGKITDWNSLGGPKHKIYSVTRESGDSSRKTIGAKVPGFEEVAEKSSKMIFNTPEAAEVLDQHPYTIAYLPLSMLPPNAKALTLESESPMGFVTGTNRYPIVLDLGLMYRNNPDKRVIDFIKFLKSGAAQKIMRSAGVRPAQ